MDPRDMDLIRSLYKETSRTGSNSDSSIASSSSALPEHRQIKYLGPDFTLDRDIPLDVWSNLPTRGAFYMLVRNENIQEARAVMRSIEDRFNHKFHYPWILLNNQYFTNEFRRYVAKITQSPIFYGKIDMDAWNYPSWIDVPLAELKMLEMEVDEVYKGGSLSYHQMLRYQSGLFFWHSLFKHVEYVWRVESGATYTCDMDFDPFRYMKENNKTLGFALTMREYPNAIPNLWSTTRDFMSKQQEVVLSANDTIMPWITDDEEKYNMCHIWNNFEIVDMSFLKSPSYSAYFEHLDRTGGFFYESPPHLVDKRLHNQKHDPVEQLLLRGNEITSLHVYAKALTKMKHELRELSLRDNLLHHFPKEILVLKNLTSLSFAHNQFHEIPVNTLSRLQMLQWLSLAHNKLKDLPEDLEQCRYLRGIDLENNWLEHIPKVIYQLGRLDTLLLLNNVICQLEPDPLPSKIRTLNLSYNRLTQFPSTLILHPPPFLTYLNLSANLLGHIPTDFLHTGYEYLTSLDLHTCALKKIPGSFFRSLAMRCQNLKRLNLAINGLVELPPEIGLLRSVQWLNLNDNDIETLPASFANLTSLVKLGMVENKLCELPEHIFHHLRKLSKLDLRRNQLRYLPPSIISLAPMREVNESYDLAIPRTIFPAYISLDSNTHQVNDQHYKGCEAGGLLRTLVLCENKKMEYTDGVYCQVQTDEGVIDVQLIDIEGFTQHLRTSSLPRDFLLKKVLSLANESRDKRRRSLQQQACAVATQVPSLRELAMRAFLNGAYNVWVLKARKGTLSESPCIGRLDIYPDLREQFLDAMIPETIPRVLQHDMHKRARQCDSCNGWYTYSPVKLGYLSRLCENRTVVPIRSSMCSMACVLDCMLRIITAKHQWRPDTNDPAAELGPRVLFSEWALPVYSLQSTPEDVFTSREREPHANSSLPEACIVHSSLKKGIKGLVKRASFVFHSMLGMLTRKILRQLRRITAVLLPGSQSSRNQHLVEYSNSPPSPLPVRSPYGDRPMHTSVTSRPLEHPPIQQHYQILQPLPSAPSPASFNHLPRDAIRLQRF
ncbi:alpha 1,2-mannosyltransferase 2.4.1 [Apophysomyces ossiformis]|uniref:Alpha 1,2-mannosyltransferase 2.4.1 n=1 Tax=Apophysomyces ossiformis TaxID=679940 RepID=A0A8H7BMI6_9FUNG|nr:alpha 1,2-mannosyltransferase 2.4.1 [Apophysomyces ossiformis]